MRAGKRAGTGVTSIIILSYNTLDCTRLCIESVRSYTEAGSYELVVVDNGSTDGSAEWLKEQDDLVLWCNRENRGFPGGCNQGLRMAVGDTLLFLNSDTIVTPNWLSNMRRALCSADDIGAVGCVTNYCSNGQTIPARYESLEEMAQFAAAYNVSDPSKWHPWLMLVGFAYLMKREAYVEVGGFDERFNPGNYEDDDLSVRLRLAGYDLLLLQDTFIHHFGSASFGRNVSSEEFRKKQEAYTRLLARNQAYFQQKWAMGTDYKTGWDLSQILPTVLAEGARITLVNCREGWELYMLSAQHPEAQVCGIVVGAAHLPLSPRVQSVRAADWAHAEDCVQADQDYIIVLENWAVGEVPSSLIHSLAKHLKNGGKLVYAEGDCAHTLTRDKEAQE